MTQEKEYFVSVNKSITQDFIDKMSSGIPILGTVTQKCKVEKVSDKIFKITTKFHYQIKDTHLIKSVNILKIIINLLLYIEH